MGKIKIGLGQDSHRFLPSDSTKLCIMGGIVFDNAPGFNANSDGDIVLHSICNAISSIVGIRILGGIADELCLKDGITDSQIYLEEGLKLLQKNNISINHVALSIEAKRPKLGNRVDEMRENIAKILEVDFSDVGITATTGEGLTDFGCGEGAQCFCILTCEKN